MSSAKSFIKSSVVYFVGSVLTKVISFFLLPLYTNYLVSTDMGYYDLSVSYLNILMPVICMEIWSGIMRYMYDYDELKGKFKVVTNGITLFSVSLLLYTLIFVVLNTVKDVKSIWLIYLYGLFTMIQYVYTYIARTLGYSLIFSISGILGSLVNAVSNIIMIVGFGMRLESLYIAMILGLVVQIIILETKVKLIKNVSLKQLDSSMIGSMIRFSLPLSLNSACFWFLSSYNRIGISNILGLSMNGIYSVSGKFAVVMTLVSTCFTMAWQELVCSRGNEENKSEFYTTASNYYIQFLAIGTILFLPAIKTVFPFFIGKDYQEAFNFIPLYLLGTSASIFSSFLGNIFSAEKNTSIIFTSTLVSALVNVSLLHLLIHIFGLQAANISLLCGFIVNIAIRIIIINKSPLTYIKLNYKMLLVWSAFFCLAYIVYMTQPIWVNIIFAVLFFLFALYVFRDLIKQGLQFIKQKSNKN